MTIQEKVRKMGKRMNEMRQEEPLRVKQHCFSLLHDAAIWSDSRIDEMSNDSLIGYIQLAAVVVQARDPDFSGVRFELANLGFNTSPLN